MSVCRICGQDHREIVDGTGYFCRRCGRPLPAATGNLSAFFGMAAGATLGGAMWGPTGALLAGLAGGALGKATRGLG